MPITDMQHWLTQRSATERRELFQSLAREFATAHGDAPAAINAADGAVLGYFVPENAMPDWLRQLLAQPIRSEIEKRIGQTGETIDIEEMLNRLDAAAAQTAESRSRESRSG